jgi:hypothetical protein
MVSISKTSAVALSLLELGHSFMRFSDFGNDGSNEDYDAL